MRSLKSRHGFTIVELIIVITVLALLVTLVISRYQNISEEAKFAQVATNLVNLRSAVSRFYSYNSSYPTLAEMQSLSGLTTIKNTVDETAIYDFIETVPYTPQFTSATDETSDHISNRNVYEYSNLGLVDNCIGGWVYDADRGVVYPNLPETQFGARDWWIENSNF